MTNTQLLSGKDVSESVYSSISERISILKDKNIIPGLAVILVGNDPASSIYVRSKTKTFKRLKLHTNTLKLPSSISQKELIKSIKELNSDPQYHGILVQLPLPKHINSDVVIKTIDPNKDVDGFHPENAGLLSIGRPRFIPCTPKGVMRLFEYYDIKLNGKHIVILGRSNIVGRPLSILTSLKMKNANGTTTLCHSRTKNIEHYTKQADVTIVALGFPEFLKGHMIKQGSIVIDVGINRVEDRSEKGYKLVGDTHWDEIIRKASAATPVPGGVGPMTIAMLVENTIEAAENCNPDN